MRLSPRQRRLIECLLSRPHSRYELTDKIGSLNPCDVVYRLRKRGLNIICDRKTLVDRDGIKTKPGIYRLPNDEVEKARELLSGAVTPPNCSNHSTTQEY